MDKLIDMLNDGKNVTIEFREEEAPKKVKEIAPEELKKELASLKEGDSLIVRF